MDHHDRIALMLATDHRIAGESYAAGARILARLDGRGPRLVDYDAERHRMVARGIREEIEGYGRVLLGSSYEVPEYPETIAGTISAINGRRQRSRGPAGR